MDHDGLMASNLEMKSGSWVGDGKMKWEMLRRGGGTEMKEVGGGFGKNRRKLSKSCLVEHRIAEEMRTPSSVKT